MNLPISNRKRKPKKKQQNNIPLTVQIHNELQKEKNKSRTVKYFDTFIQYSITTVPLIGVLSPIPQGVSQSERIADTIWVNKIQFKGEIVNYNTDLYSQIRFFLFVYKNNDTITSPSALTIFDTNYSSWTTLTPRNFERRKDFRLVSKDYWIKVISSSTSLTNIGTVNLDETLGLNNSRIDYDLGVNTGTGNLYYVFASDSAVSPSPAITFQFRLWYYDE